MKTKFKDPRPWTQKNAKKLDKWFFSKTSKWLYPFHA